MDLHAPEVGRNESSRPRKNSERVKKTKSTP
ncbi:uncharacterized protein G2W53_010605 [Senna tora]|uniref:Uncharacterized protein n=1 Tax=Senna tora TaxID=362788 RepID=A0A834X062_9FABA|nr:uncharacterized protein G2W53_010605 [Senna tora]